MPSKNRIDAQNAYAAILEEIKLRVASINHSTSGGTGLAPPFVVEFCFLQTRVICELVAMACLIAHGDLEAEKSSKLQKEWSAERIMNELEKLHPHFYPQPIAQTKTADGFHIQAVPSPLTKAEFIRLYGKCGDALHRGSVRKLIRSTTPQRVHYPEITSQLQPLIDLISNHVLVMQSGEQMFLAMLANNDDGGRCQVAIAETPKGFPMDFTSPNFLRDPPDAEA